MKRILFSVLMLLAMFVQPVHAEDPGVSDPWCTDPPNDPCAVDPYTPPDDF